MMTQYTIALRCRNNKYYPTGLKNINGTLQLTSWQNSDATAVNLPLRAAEQLADYHNLHKPKSLVIAGVELLIDQPQFVVEVLRVYEVMRWWK